MSANNNDRLEKQAIVFARYYIHRDPSTEVVERYIQIIRNTKGIKLSHSEDQLLHMIVDHPFLLRGVDGALALRSPDSEIRRRLYIMFAVLEATPDYADIFLPKPHNPIYALWVGILGIRAAIAALFGLILIRNIK